MTDTADTSLLTTASGKPPFYRDTTIIKWIVQVFTLVVVIFALYFLSKQAGDNLKARDINTGFDFLSVNPSFAISDGIDTAPNTGGRALWVGMVNTIRMSLAGILAATILGILVGVSRLSNNWIVAKVASAFIEYMRNIPLLVHILLIFFTLGQLGDFGKEINGVTGKLEQGPINGWIHISNKGLSVPRIHISDGFYQWAVFLIIGAIVGRWVMNKRTAARDGTGAETYPVLSFLGVLALFGFIGWFLHPFFGWLGDAIFGPISRLIPNIPQIAVQLALTALALVMASLWIQRFLTSRRTPAGLARLTDDDWFRMIFAGAAAVIAGVVFLVIWPGLSSWIINSSRDFFEVATDKFGDGRGNWREDWPIDAARPDISKRGNFANPGPAGLNFSQGFAAVFFGVVLYTSAFIAEIVRGGILAVPKGQTEAAQAVGLKRSTMLRLVVLPQAFRVSLPPLGNQYLNLTKNTSLAIAVGYSDVVQIGQTIFNQTGRSLEVFAIWMLFYVACSLAISAVVNFFNVRLLIVER